MDMNSTATLAAAGGDPMYSYIVNDVATWTWAQLALFPWLFIIPAEIMAGMSDTLIYFWGKGPLPSAVLPKYRDPALQWHPDIAYIAFNRLVVLPFLSFLIVRTVWNSAAVIFDMEAATLANTIGAFLVVFALSDFTYYVSHRIVHKVGWLYSFVHKHHHGEGYPRRGWADTSNAHPTDFFYTGFCTSPISVLWLMPAGTVHITAIMACLYLNAFFGALGHCRLDFNVGFFNTRFHAGHHAMSTCNFAQNVEIWDRLFGTFRPLPMKKGKFMKVEEAHTD